MLLQFDDLSNKVEMENSTAFSIKYMHIPLSESVSFLAVFMLVKGRPMHAEHLLLKSKLYFSNCEKSKKKTNKKTILEDFYILNF